MAQPPPDDLGERGRNLWVAVQSTYDLEPHEASVLVEAARTADALDGLAGVVEAEGLMAETSQGPRVHPALVEARQQRIALARLLTALKIPASDDEARDQTRGGTRGVYPIRGAS